MIQTGFSDQLEVDTAPLVSVVLPVYNAGVYLIEAVDSILTQTFTDFELIMIDDGSRDSSLSIMKEYERKDPRVRVIARENRGLATTLNESIDFACGKWVARMDQDDIALPYRLARQLEWLEATGADIAGSWVRRFGTSDKRVVRLHTTNETIKIELLFNSAFAHPSVIMRTTLLRKLRYDRAFEKAEDYDLWERAAEAGWKMTNVPEVLLLYRVHQTQISAEFVIEQQQQGQEIRRRYWKFVFNSLNLNSKSIDKTLKIFNAPLLEIDMNAVEASFTALLRNAQNESRDVIFLHATRLYYRAAASCEDIVSRWGKLNQEFGEGSGVATKMKLALFRLLRIREGTFLFRCFKMLYNRGIVR